MQFAAKISEIPDWGKKVVVVNGREILLIKAKGNIFACENECPHQGVPLGGALIKDAETLVCQHHGYSFNLKSGACKQFPEYTLKIYPVQLQGEEILVDIG